jgi:hypothetical protein
VTHIDGDKVNLGVAVLARFRGGHVDDFAGATCDASDDGSGGEGGKLPLITTWPFLRRAEHCMGKVSEAPEAVCQEDEGGCGAGAGRAHLLKGLFMLLVVGHGEKKMGGEIKGRFGQIFAKFSHFKVRYHAQSALPFWEPTN